MMQGWNIAEYDDSDWENASKANPQPKGKLVSQTIFLTIKVSKILYPKKIIFPTPGIYIYDFGQNFTGWTKFRSVGKKGDKVKIRYAELLNNEGILNTIPNRGVDARDVYIFKGIEEEVCEPLFTYHGFRNVEITGFPQ